LQNQRILDERERGTQVTLALNMATAATAAWTQWMKDNFDIQMGDNATDALSEEPSEPPRAVMPPPTALQPRRRMALTIPSGGGNVSAR
jgi:hypothetical protein